MAEQLSLGALSDLALAVLRDFARRGLLQEWFGYDCIDAGDVPGRAGDDPADYVLLVLGRSDIWPYWTRAQDYDEDTLFDVLEFLYDRVSAPSGGYHHTHASCGWHYSLDDSRFESAPAQAEFRERISPLLGRYSSGYAISIDGEIQHRAVPGTERLLSAPLPTKDDTLAQHVSGAVAKYLRRQSTSTDRRDAVRDLADALERIRPHVKEHMLSRDERDLFLIANNFGIRHLDLGQKQDYESELWWAWMFYVFLASLHLTLRLARRSTEAKA